MESTGNERKMMEKKAGKRKRRKEGNKRREREAGKGGKGYT